MRRLAIILVWEICRFIDFFSSPGVVPTFAKSVFLDVVFIHLLSQCLSFQVASPKGYVCVLVECLCGIVRVWAIDIVNGCVYLLCAFSILTKSFSRFTQQFIYVVSQWWRQLNLSTRRTLFNGLSLCENETADLSST